MSTELLKSESPGELSTQTPNAMQLLQAAISQGASIDTIERLAKLQREMVEYQAQVEFNDAMQRAQASMRRIGTDAVNPQTKSSYATYAKLDGALRPIYSREGFSLSFNSGEGPSTDMVRVLCYVSRGGHTRTYQIDMPADGKGAKGGDVMTKTHATGAAASYGMRYLLKMIFNVATGESDDDGNSASKSMDRGEFDRLCGLIENAGSPESLKTTYLAACEDAKELGDQGAINTFAKLKNARWKELHANR